MEATVHDPRSVIADPSAGRRSLLGRALDRLRESVAEPVLTVLFPPRCVMCGEFETHLCDRCRDGLVAVASGSCPRCGEPGVEALVQGRCAACMGRELEHDGARSAYLHQGAAKRLVSELKFGGQPVLGRLMAGLAQPMFDEYARSLALETRLYVSWVPAHRRAQRERGYNQAELLARHLAAGYGLPAGPLVRKGVPTKHQKGLGRAGRQSNLRGAFSLHPAAAESLKSHGCGAVIMVDDVYTTGATAGEVSRVVKAGLGLPTFVFTFSRATSGKAVGHD